MADFDELVIEYQQRLLHLFRKLRPTERVRTAAELLAGGSAVGAFEDYIGRLEFVPHEKALIKLESDLGRDRRWEKRKREVVAALLPKLLDDVIAEQVRREVTEPLWGLTGPIRDGEVDGTLELDLVDSIPAANLKALLATVGAAYTLSVWQEQLGRSDHDSEQVTLSGVTAEDTLWIAELHIGTPNRLKLRGRLRHLARVATLLTTVLGTPIAVTEAYNNFAEAKKNLAEAQKLRADEIVLTLSVIEQAHKLYSEGKLSKEAYERVTATTRDLTRDVVESAPIIRPQRIDISSEKPAGK